jgi:hypothetical protein
MEAMLTEKVRQRTFLYYTKSPGYRDQHIRANAWEGIGKELKIKGKFYVSSRDVRIVCPRLKKRTHMTDVPTNRNQEVSAKHRCVGLSEWHAATVRVGKSKHHRLKFQL